MIALSLPTPSVFCDAHFYFLPLFRCVAVLPLNFYTFPCSIMRLGQISTNVVLSILASTIFRAECQVPTDDSGETPLITTSDRDDSISYPDYSVAPNSIANDIATDNAVPNREKVESSDSANGISSGSTTNCASSLGKRGDSDPLLGNDFFRSPVFSASFAEATQPEPVHCVLRPARDST